jgi:hypothetical protein
MECACTSLGLNFLSPLAGGLPSPFISQREGSGYRGRERKGERKRSPWDHAASPPIRMGPAGPVDDDGYAPMPRPGVTCGASPNGIGGAGLAGHRTSDVRPTKMDNVNPLAHFTA